MTNISPTDVRREQLVLLRFEKELARLAALVAAGAATAASAAEKIDADASTGAYENIKAALVHLAEVTGEAHAAINARAAEVGARMFEASGGWPKTPPAEVVRSILGLG
jgi:hypothetical protein